MIQERVLLWALVSVSLFETILLLWLGLTLWLNADRRGLGVVVTSVGFFLGSAFFTSHAALLLRPTLQLTRSTTLWLALAMTPVVLLPYVWYVVLLWYNGFWTPPAGGLRRRQVPWLWLATAVLVAGMVSLALLGAPFVPLGMQVAPLFWPARDFIKTPVLGIPLVAIGFPLYVLLCVLLSLDATRRPGLTGRVLGEEARERARPWLTAATLLLLVVGILVAVVVLWTITHTKVGGYYVLTPNRMDVIGRFDLVICLLIAAVTVLLGQAVTAYELFTGKALPRKGLARQWRRALGLAGGYGVLMASALVWGLDEVYAMLLTAILMTAFFALLSWRSFVEWEQGVKQLRPFVASQRWYEALVTRHSPSTPSNDPFRALCSDVLNASVAYLIPTGSTSTFVTPMVFPEGLSPVVSALPPVMEKENSLVVAVDPSTHGGASWAVRLWSERGLVGVLLLGGRRDGGLYTQEEMEIARSTGERLIDSAASLAMSQRLMQLQRERMAANQILDQRTRRVLHDDVLPSIQTTMLSLAAGAPVEPVVKQLSELHSQLADLLHELPPAAAPEISRLGLIGALRRAVQVEFSQQFEKAEWAFAEEVEQKARELAPVAAETVYFAARELVRNAAKHAHPEEGSNYLRLKITASVAGDLLQLVIEDNGAKWTSVPANLGQGLSLHGTMMAVVGGSLSIETDAHATRAFLSIPLAR